MLIRASNAAHSRYREPAGVVNRPQGAIRGGLLDRGPAPAAIRRALLSLGRPLATGVCRTREPDQPFALLVMVPVSRARLSGRAREGSSGLTAPLVPGEGEPIRVDAVPRNS
jgi:hypothetical protein